MKPTLADALRYELAKRFKTARMRQRLPHQSHHASDAESCLRRQSYAWLGYEADNPGAFGLVQEMGNVVEDFAANILESLFAKVERGVWVEAVVGDHPMRGKLDFLVSVSPEDWAHFFPQYEQRPVPLEVKSLDSTKYGTAVLKGPSQNHTAQLNVYTVATGAPFGLMMYVQREASSEIPFNMWVMPADVARYQETLSQFRAVEQYVTFGVVPPPLCKKDKLDPFCPWTKVRCPSDGGWAPTNCKVCGKPLDLSNPSNAAQHADCMFGNKLNGDPAIRPTANR